jgi:hypothetical protein
MRDRPDGYLFDSREECCEVHFAWDKSCGFNSPTGIWYYPQYDESTCYQKPLGQFGKHDTEKFATKNICCMEKFASNAQACCAEGNGECSLTGMSVYVANWITYTCQEKDIALLPDWENEWTSNTVEDCCEQREFVVFL